MYPEVKNPELVGSYESLAFAGGGYVWDEVLEYRVWCYPKNGAENLMDGEEYYYPFESYDEAEMFYQSTNGAQSPLALILQNEYIDEPEFGRYIHVKEQRITEWPVVFLYRPQRTENTIPNFMSPHVPINKLDILRGIA